MRQLSLLLLIVFGGGLAQAADADYLAQLQAQAAELELADTRHWHALMHYEDNWLRPGLTSTVATPWFFTAEAGRSDPIAELNATLAAFFDNSSHGPREEPAQCVFRARYQFLDARLEFDPRRLPPAECQDFDKWMAGLAPESVSLIFPSAFLNSPASMFGHTLLRVDSEDQKRKTELLAYAINFAASTENEGGAMFAIKGLAGGYPGVFGLFPYYEKVKQYAWIENRDVWAYRLQFSDEEIRRMLAHLWEMRGVEFDYYFLIKNCSYQLLSLIQAGRPSLHLVERFDWYAIPADTIRALRQVPGLLATADYRPALRTTLESRIQGMDASTRALAVDLANGDLQPQAEAIQALPPQQRARVLEVAHDYLYYRYQTDAVPREVGLPRARAILLARSKVRVKAGFSAVPTPDIAPDAGHPTLRLTAEPLWEDGVVSLGLRVRPAYHDVLDPGGGYTDGAQINFLDLALRADPGEPDLKLDYLTLIDILSLSPRDALFKPVSWQVATGLRRRPLTTIFGDDPNDVGAYAQGGPGLAWGSFDSAVAYVFGLASADGNAGFESDYALGGGASAGLLVQPFSGWRLRAEAGLVHYAVGDGGRRRWAKLEQQWRLAENLGLRLRLGWEAAAGVDIGRAGAALHAYF